MKKSGASFSGRKPPSAGKKRKVNPKTTVRGNVKAKAPVGNSARGISRGAPATKVKGKVVKGAGPKGKRAKGYTK